MRLWHTACSFQLLKSDLHANCSIALANGFLMLLISFLMSGCQGMNRDDGKAAEAGKAFLAQNAGKPGVITTASGLQYQVLQEGKGRQPSATDLVRVNYAGSLVDGREFDRGEGIEFPLNRVIPGWTEGLQLMKEGGKTRFSSLRNWPMVSEGPAVPFLRMPL